MMRLRHVIPAVAGVLLSATVAARLQSAHVQTPSTDSTWRQKLEIAQRPGKVSVFLDVVRQQVGFSGGHDACFTEVFGAEPRLFDSPRVAAWDARLLLATRHTAVQRARQTWFRDAEQSLADGLRDCGLPALAAIAGGPAAPLGLMAPAVAPFVLAASAGTAAAYAVRDWLVIPFFDDRMYQLYKANRAACGQKDPDGCSKQSFDLSNAYYHAVKQKMIDAAGTARYDVGRDGFLVDEFWRKRLELYYQSEYIQDHWRQLWDDVWAPAAADIEAIRAKIRTCFVATRAGTLNVKVVERVPGVFSSADTPIGRARVRIDPQPGTRPTIQQLRYNEQWTPTAVGAFQILNVRPGRYVVTANALGFRPGHLDVVIDEPAPPDDDVKDVSATITLEPAIVVRVRTVDAETREPLASARVSDGSDTKNAVPDAVFYYADEGRRTLVGNAKGYEQGAIEVDVRASRDALVVVDLPLRRETLRVGQLLIDVRDEGGDLPVVGANVVVDGVGKPGARVTFDGLAPGEHQVVVTAPNYEDARIAASAGPVPAKATLVKLRRTAAFSRLAGLQKMKWLNLTAYLPVAVKDDLTFAAPALAFRNTSKTREEGAFDLSYPRAPDLQLKWTGTSFSASGTVVTIDATSHASDTGYRLSCRKRTTVRLEGSFSADLAQLTSLTFTMDAELFDTQKARGEPEPHKRQASYTIGAGGIPAADATQNSTSYTIVAARAGTASYRTTASSYTFEELERSMGTRTSAGEASGTPSRILITFSGGDADPVGDAGMDQVNGTLWLKIVSAWTGQLIKSARVTVAGRSVTGNTLDIEGLPVGPQAVEIIAEGHTPYAGTIGIVPGRPSSPTTITLTQLPREEMGYLAIRVVDARTGQPISARVEFEDGSVHAGSDVSFGPVTVGPHRMTVSASGYVTETVGIGAQSGSAGSPTLVHLRSTRPDARGTATVRVVDYDTERDIPDARVQIDIVVKYGSPVVIGDLAIGEHVLTVSAPGYEDPARRMTMTVSEAKLSPSGLVRLRRLRPAVRGRLIVTVIDADSRQPVSNARVVIDGRMRTGGTITADSLDLGDHRIDVTASGYGDARPTTVRLTASQPEYSTTIVLARTRPSGPGGSPAQGSFTVEVLEAQTGRPVSGALIEVEGRQSRGSAAEFKGLMNGSYRVTVTAPGYAGATTMVDVRAGRATPVATIRLERTGRVNTGTETPPTLDDSSKKQPGGNPGGNPGGTPRANPCAGVSVAQLKRLAPVSPCRLACYPIGGATPSDAELQRCLDNLNRSGTTTTTNTGGGTPPPPPIDPTPPPWTPSVPTACAGLTVAAARSGSGALCLVRCEQSRPRDITGPVTDGQLQSCIDTANRGTLAATPGSQPKNTSDQPKARDTVASVMTGRWTGRWANSRKGESDSSMNLSVAEDGTITGTDDGLKILDGRLSGNTMTWRMELGTTVWKVTTTILEVGKRIHSEYEAFDPKQTSEKDQGHWTGKWDLTKR